MNNTVRDFYSNDKEQALKNVQALDSTFDLAAMSSLSQETVFKKIQISIP